MSKETYYRLTEENSWEGETWYHYFLDQPGVLQALNKVMEIEGSDFTGLKKMELSDEEATILANIDDEGYMRPHFFGELDISKLTSIDSENHLYKGKIRDYAEDLFW